MTETEVQIAFEEHLRERGWDVFTENPDHTDVIAKRGTERIVAEVKGHTSSPGTDVDTMYGQLLRRMGSTENESGETRYAIVLPASWHKTAVRVPAGVRTALDIDIWTVDESGAVQLTPKPSTTEVRGEHSD